MFVSLNSNTTGVIIGAGITYPSGVHTLMLGL